jgi:type II secretion system protein N
VASKKRLILQVLAYTLYGLVVCLVIFYVTFPYELVRQRLVERFSQGDIQLAVTRIRPGFPLGVSLQNVRLLASHLNLDRAILQVQTLHLRPVWLPLLSGTLQVRVEATLYDGHLQGDVRPLAAGAGTTWEVRGRFADLHLERHPLVRREGEAFLRGRLKGDVTLTFNDQGRIQQGTVNLRLQPVVFVGGQPSQLPLQRDVTCDTLQSQLKLSARQLQIASFVCRGDDLTIQARGTVHWRQPLKTSALNLHLQIRSETVYKQELDLIGAFIRRRPDRRGVLSFSIRGTLRRPRFGA